MKFEKLDISNSKKGKWFLYGLAMGVALLAVSNLLFAKAKYKTVDSVKLAEGTINYTSADLNVIAMYKSTGKNDVLIEEIPKGNYEIDNEKSYCIVGSTEERITNNMEYTGDKVRIDITKKGTKCYVYFTNATLKTLAALGLSTEEAREGKESFSSTACGSCADSNSGLFKGTDDYGITYYYRGTVDNNWVKFADMYWRIIRINGDGTIRLIYSGDTAQKTGKGTSINDDANVQFNDTFNDNKYVGYMYDGEKKSPSTTYNNEMSDSVTNSTILDTIKEWYDNKIGKNEEYKNKIDGATGFCGDRSKASSNHGNIIYTNQGYGTFPTIYGAYDRFLNPSSTDWDTTQEPTFTCKNKKRDLYTTSDSAGQGNGKLPVPVGLITADEVVFAGGLAGQPNDSYYLYTGRNYWTMSPRGFDDGYAYVFGVYSDGSLGRSDVSDTRGVRPVINLKAGTKFKTKSPDTAGPGNMTNPYEVS